MKRKIEVGQTYYWRGRKVIVTKINPPVAWARPGRIVMVHYYDGPAWGFGVIERELV